MPRTGKAQRKLNKSHDFRDAIESMLADHWARLYLRESALEFLESLLRKNRFYLFSKDQMRVFDEIKNEMRPFRGFGGLSINQLVNVAILCKADCVYRETEDLIDDLAEVRPNELPLGILWRLIAICRLRIWLPELEDEFAPPPDKGDEEERLERAEARPHYAYAK